MSAKTIAVFAPMYPPAYRGGGPIRSLHAIVAAAPPSYRTLVVTRDHDLGVDTPLPVPLNTWVDRDRALVRFTTTRSPIRYLAMLASVRRHRPGVLYFNSFFDPSMSIFPQALTLIGWWRGAARVVAVRGEFSEAALALQPRRKRLWVATYRALGLSRRTIWHATSEREALDVRRVAGNAVRVVIRSDGGNPPIADPDALEGHDGALRALFVGRLVPIKGLEDALRSFIQSESTFTFDIYGPPEDEHYAERCRALAEQLPSNISVSFCGEVEPQRMPVVMGGYDVLIMPTHSENFGHVIGEALAAGLPVLVRDVTPWTSHIEDGGGRIVPDATGWRDAIAEFANASAGERLERRRSAIGAYRAWRSELGRGHLFDDFVVTSCGPRAG